jgi:hypothetical protein
MPRTGISREIPRIDGERANARVAGCEACLARAIPGGLPRIDGERAMPA